jgi:hypothetical protein
MNILSILGAFGGAVFADLPTLESYIASKNWAALSENLIVLLGTAIASQQTKVS